MRKKLSNDLFMFKENVFICNMYIPPSGSTVIDNRTYVSLVFTSLINILRQKQSDFQQVVDNIETITDINGVTNSFITLLQYCTITIVKLKKIPTLIKKPWLNAECYNARKCFNNARNNVLRNKDNVDLRIVYLTDKTSYCKSKTACKPAYLTHEKINLSALDKLQ